VLVKVETEARRAEFLFAQIANVSMGFAQTRAAVIAERTRRAPTWGSRLIFDVPVCDDPAVVVVHRPKYTIEHRRAKVGRMTQANLPKISCFWAAQVAQKRL